MTKKRCGLLILAVLFLASVLYVYAAPITTLVSPADNHVDDTAASVNITFSCSATSADLANISLYLTDSSNSNFAQNQVTVVTGTSNSSNWTVELSTGNYTWNCLSANSTGATDWAANRSITLNYTAPATPAATGGGGGKKAPNYDLTMELEYSDTFTAWLFIGREFTYEFDGGGYTIEMVRTTWRKGKFQMKIMSELKSFEVGDTVKLDLDGDGVKDLMLSFDDIAPNSVEITVTKIEESAVVTAPVLSIGPVKEVPEPVGETTVSEPAVETVAVEEEPAPVVVKKSAKWVTALSIGLPFVLLVTLLFLGHLVKEEEI